MTQQDANTTDPAQMAPCPECGGQCAPECGLHPAGCVYGGFSELTAYWLVSAGCDREH